MLEAMDPIAVTAALLRAQLPDVPLREGATLMARVASRGESHAVIVLAGIPVTAQIPPEVEAGATLRLKVQEVTPERVTLRIDPAGSAGTGAGRRPGHARRRCRVRRSRSRSRRPAAAAPTASRPTSSRSRSTRPTLGRLDLRLELRGDRLLAEVTTPAGRPHAVAERAAERLRAKLDRGGTRSRR